MSEILDFTGTNDTGEADEEAISPVENGENAVEEVFNRPTHVLRNRSEILRGEVNQRRWTDDADRGITFSLDGGTLTWGGPADNAGTGELVLAGGSLGMIIAPMYNPGNARGDFFEDSGTLWPTRLAHFTSENISPGQQDIQWLSQKFDYEGGNQITITVTGVAGYGATTVDVNGDGTVANPGINPGQDDIVVTYDSTGGVTIADILSAVNGDSIANQLVTPTYTGSDPSSSAAYDIATTALSGGIDSVFHRIPLSNLATFFSTSTDNLLNNGDTLAIWYNDTQNRRRSIEENTESTIPAASLVNLTREPDKAPNSVIIGRAIDDAFVLANGLEMTTGVAYTGLSNVSTADRLSVDASGFTQLSTLSTTQQEVNEDIDTELGVVDGYITGTSVGQYDSLQDLIVALGDGRVGVVRDTLGGKATFGDDVLATTNLGTTAALGSDVLIDTDGEFVYVAGTNTNVIEQYRSDDMFNSGTVTVGTGTISAMACDGYKLVFNVGNTVYQYDVAALTQDWSWNAGNAASQIFCDGQNVWVTINNAGDADLYKIATSSSGTLTGLTAETTFGSYAVKFLHTNGSLVFVSGNPTSFSETITLFAHDYNSPATQVFQKTTVITSPNGGVSPAEVAYDGEWFWFGDDRIGEEFHRSTAGRGLNIDNYSLSAITTNVTESRQVAADTRYAYLFVRDDTLSEALLLKINRATGTVVSRYSTPGSEYVTMMADGINLWAVDTSGADYVLRKLYTAPGPVAFTRVVPDNTYRYRDVFYQKAIPASFGG